MKIGGRAKLILWTPDDMEVLYAIQFDFLLSINKVG